MYKLWLSVHTSPLEVAIVSCALLSALYWISRTDIGPSSQLTEATLLIAILELFVCIAVSCV